MAWRTHRIRRIIMSKRILFICPKYFNYCNVIRDELLKLGHIVDMISYNATGFSLVLLNKIGLAKKQKSIYYNKYRKLVNKNKYDLLFVIKGDVFSEETWKKIFAERKFKNSVLYQWDSFSNYNYKNLIKIFDKTFSFDRSDSNRFERLIYLPLFYYGDFCYQEQIEYDLLFVGIWHSDRIEILNKIGEIAEYEGLKVYFKIYYPFLSWLYLRLKNGKSMQSPYLTFKKISQKHLSRLYRKTKCIIDIANPRQSGLTMRTIECVGANKKLITTNQNIAVEDFYCENIQIVRRDTIENIDLNYINTKSEYPNREKYRLDNWLKSILPDE